MKQIKLFTGRLHSTLLQALLRLRLKHVLALLLLIFMTTVRAQSDNSPKEFRNIPLKTVIQFIETKYDYSFIYDNTVVDVRKTVSISIGNQPIEQLLVQLFGDSEITYLVSNKQIALSKKQKTTKTITVSGKVTDSSGNAMPGVTVIVRGQQTGAVTDERGHYSISPVNADAVLQFSFVGMKTELIPVNGRTVVNATLNDDAILMNEVVAVGYSTLKKRDITGSIASVKGDQLSKSAFSDLAQSLQGQTAGVYVVSSSGKPGSATSVRIRGVGGINNSEPLYIVDGVQGVDISRINTDDIESIEILKDASSSAIYGARGANGVVLVTTKKGQAGSLKVSYAGSLGFQNIMNVGNIQFLTGRQFAENFNTAYLNDGLQAPFGGTNTTEFPRAFFPAPSEITSYTNWWDVMTQKSAPVTEHVVSVNGGNEKQQMYLSFGYYNQEGLFIRTGYDRFTVRMNSEHAVNKWMKIGNNTSLSRSKSIGGGESNTYSDTWRAISFNPLVKVFNEDGSFAGPPHTLYESHRTPYANAMMTDQSVVNNDISNNLYAVINFSKKLSLRTSLSTTYNGMISDYFNNGIFKEGIVFGTNTQIYYTKNELFNYLWGNVLSYKNELGKHTISALAGYEMQEMTLNRMYGEAQYADPTIRIVNTKLGTNALANTGITEGSMLSYFGNASYNYADKYYLTANVRRDGSSKFGVNNRVGIFPSVSGAWRISGENFFDIKPVSDLKLRASWGEVGNDQIGYFSYLAPMRAVVYPMSGLNNSSVTGSVYTTLANPDLKWEVSRQLNVGLDMALLNNHLTLTAEYFKTDVRDMLLGILIPTTTGISAFGYGGKYSSMVTNAGSLTNQGFELDARYYNTIGELKYSIGANLTTYNNTVTEIGGNEYLVGNVSRTYVGGSLGDFYGYVSDGIFQNQAELDAANAIDGDAATPYQYAGTKPGDFRYKDLNNDGRITDKDRTVIGSPIPDFTYGLSLSGEYRNFTLSALFSGVQGNQIYNKLKADVLHYSGPQLVNVSADVLNAWNGEGTSTTIARRTKTNANAVNGPKSLYVEDGSYFRLRTLQLAYNFPATLIEPLSVSKASVFFSADNVFTLTKYSGFDPEVTNKENLNAGVDDAFYPHGRIITCGINITF